MPNDVYDQLIEQGEIAREKENYSEALTALDKALIIAARDEQWTQLVNALAHKLLTYKHLFQKTGKDSFLELMLGEAQTGLKISEDKKILGQPKAVMLLRIGDYHFLKEEFAKAMSFYEEALENIEKEKKGEHAEYLSHLGLCQAELGKQEGLDNINQALQLALADDQTRPFHKLVILSGIHMRQAVAYNKFKQFEQAKASFEIAKTMAEELALEHKMSMRLKQLEKVKQGLGL